jgi:D-alanyl-lipoteichoic acid acyltransferase DltB (MBOAT superfamily)
MNSGPYGAVYFAFQIYGDFSGYSDMALGMSKLFGMDLLRNFNYPYREILPSFGALAYILSSWFRTIYIFHLVEVKVLK